MLTAVHIYRSTTEHFDLPIDGQGMFKVKNIDGLDPVPAVFSSMDLGDVSRSEYGYGAISTRTITFEIALNPDWSTGMRVQDLRKLLYSYFPSHTLLKMHFFDTVLTEVWIEGKVEEISPVIFTNEPSVKVSVLCAKPQFVSAAETVIANVPLAPRVGIYQNATVQYEGTAETGFTLEFVPTTGPIADFFLPGLSSGNAPDLIVGSRALLSTIPGAKSLKYQTSTGVITDYSKSVFYTMARKSTLLPGSNILQFYGYRTSDYATYTVENFRYNAKYSSL